MHELLHEPAEIILSYIEPARLFVHNFMSFIRNALRFSTKTHITMHSLSHFRVSIKLYSNRVNGSIRSDSCLLLQVLFKGFISLLEIKLAHFKNSSFENLVFILFRKTKNCLMSLYRITLSHEYQLLKF